MLSILNHLGYVVAAFRDNNQDMDDLLTKAGFVNRKLRIHQNEGVEWLCRCFNDQNGCILADEMGLGKTTQSLAFFSLNIDSSLPSMIIAPLSVLGNWLTEFENFLPSLNVKKYYGDINSRLLLQHSTYDVLVTTYEIFLKDSSFFSSRKWHIAVIDEGHRLKNSEGSTSKLLREVHINFRLLLSGTPVQNNIRELYSLLSFIDDEAFPFADSNEFCERYENESTSDELHDLLRPYLLRRTKNQVLVTLPPSEESILTCDMSFLQKKVYKACLVKDGSVIELESNKSVLQNTIMQLRKCSNHPYMFIGIEPEPFCIGEHIVEASGKLQALDKILKYCKENQHRVLIFSQFTLTLDIIQDYAQYRNFSYERLDGSVRDEERYNSITNFCENEVFCFLLSTRAGGVGLNLTAADTIVFFDSDWNPQNDIQAAARAHRIGQTKPVKIIRLISKNTVDEYMLKKMETKLNLTKRVITEGSFSSLAIAANDTKTLSDMLMFGLSDLFEGDESSDDDLSRVLGETNAAGEWVFVADRSDNNSEIGGNVEDFYDFEGENYRKNNVRNKKAFQNIISENNRSLKANDSSLSRPNKRIHLTSDDQEEQNELLEQHQKLLLEQKRATREAKKLQKWSEMGYISTALPYVDLPSLGSSITLDMEYVVGDVTLPDKSGIVVHCTDSNGRWGSGGLFSALDKQSDSPKKCYELAKDVDDLKQGQCHLVSYSNDLSVALLMCIKRGPSSTKLDLKSLNDALTALGNYAKSNNKAIHMPRIGFKTSDWYSTERLLRKCLLSQDVPTTVYYYSRGIRSNTASKAGHSSSSRPNNSSYFCQNATNSKQNKVNSNFKTKVDNPIKPVNKLQPSSSLSQSFTNSIVYLDPALKPCEMNVLKRYIIAANGEIQSYLDRKITCVVSYNSNFDDPCLNSATVVNPYSISELTS